MSSASRPVYSTEQGRLCPECGQALAACRCREASDKPVAGDGVVRIRLETKGRKGKGVTVITGLALPGADLARLGTRLKQLAGSGGTVKDGVIEVQGDHRDKLIVELQRQGLTVKRVG